MKDILIKGRTLKKELIIASSSFVIAFCLNIYSIVYYNTPWSELYTQIFWVLTLAILIYSVSVFLRFILSLIFKLFKTKNK